MHLSCSISKSEFKSWLAAAAYSFILFSPTTYKIFNVGGRYFFELAALTVIAFHIIFRDNLGREFARSLISNRVSLSFAAFFIATFFVIGSFRHGRILDAYAQFRSSLFLVVGFIVCRHVLQRRPDYVYMLAMCTAIYSALYWLFLYSSGQLGSKFANPLFAPAVAALIGTDRAKTLQLVSAVIAVLFLSAVSFYRQYWLVALFVIVACLVRRQRGHQIISIKLVTVFVMAFIALFSYGFFNTLFNSNESLYIQSIGKTVDALNYFDGGYASDSDSLRISYFGYMYDQSFNLIFPHGLGLGTSVESENFDPWFNGISNASNTADSLFLFITYHYGYLVSIPATFWLMLRAYKSQHGRGVFSFLLLLSAFAIPLLFDGGQATVTFRAFWFGTFCAYLATPGKKKHYAENSGQA